MGYKQMGDIFTYFIRLGFLSPTLIHFCGYGCVFLVTHGHREGHLRNVNIQVCELVWSIVLTWPCAKLWFNWHECEFKLVSPVPLRKTATLSLCLSSDSSFYFCFWQLDKCSLVGVLCTDHAGWFWFSKKNRFIRVNCSGIVEHLSHCMFQIH